MYFVVDIVCILILVAAVVRSMGDSVIVPLLRTVAVLVAATIALVVTTVFAPLVSNSIVKPVVEKQVSYELSDLVSGKHLATAEETSKSMDTQLLQSLIDEKTSAFSKLVAKYGCTVEEMQNAYNKNHRAYDMVKMLSESLIVILSQLLLYFVSWIVLYWILSLLFVRKIAGNLPSKGRKKGSIRNIWAPLMGVLLGVSFIMTFSIVLNDMVRAFNGMTILFSKDIVTKGFLYPAIQKINPLCFLYNVLL